MRTEHSKKSKLADLDTALLNLKHSIKANVPDGEMLTEIGLNVLKRAQSVRDSLVKTMFQAKKPARKLSVKTAKAVAPKAKSAKSKAAASKAKTTKRKAKAAPKKKTAKKK